MTQMTQIATYIVAIKSYYSWARGELNCDFVVLTSENLKINLQVNLLRQQRVNALQVFWLQSAVGLAQFQRADQHVITRFGQVALGLK